MQQKQTLNRQCNNWEQLQQLYKKLQVALQEEMGTRKSRFEQDAMFFQKSDAAINLQVKIRDLLYHKQVPKLEMQIQQMLLRINQNIRQVEDKRASLQLRIQKQQEI